MAQQRHVDLLDDLDGGMAQSTVVFGLDGKVYEIDLSAKNEAKLRKAMEPFVTNGRRVRGGVKRAGAVRTTVTATTDTIRQWAAANGYQVAPRGRVARSVVEAFEVANT
jgi:hypothetical protein